MGKRLITQEDVRKAAEAGLKAIEAPSETCIVTPMAREEAGALGIAFCEGASLPTPPPGPEGKAGSTQAEAVSAQVYAILKERVPAGIQATQLERMVREVVAARLDASQGSGQGAETDADGVRFIDSRRLLQGGIRPVAASGKVLVAEAIGHEGKDRLSGGYMRWEKASFTRTVEKPEIGIVIEGELHLTVGGKTVIGKPGDMVYLPGGVTAVYAAPSRVLLACISCKFSTCATGPEIRHGWARINTDGPKLEGR